MEAISRTLLTFILNALWQVPLAAAVAALGGWIMRGGPAWHRHALWVAALFAAVLLPLGGIRVAGNATADRLQLSAVAQPAASTPAAEAVAVPAPAAARDRGWTISFAPTTGGFLLLAYVSFLAWRLARLARAATRTANMHAAATAARPGPVLSGVWERCQCSFGRGGVELLASGRVSGPVTAGAFRPAVILPASMLSEPSEEVLTTAIGHEMAHIARHDFAANLLYELLYLPISFHPAAMWIHREIDRTREMACDELVTARLLDPRAYAQSIVSIANGMCASPGPGYSLGIFDGNILEQRIRRLMEGRSGGLGRARAVLAAGLAALAVCAVMASNLRVSALAQNAPSAELGLAAAAYDAGDFNAAVDHFRKALAQDPNNVNIRLHLANAELRIVHPEGDLAKSPLLADARQQYLEVLARDNGNRQALERLAELDLTMGRPQEAREVALKLVQADPLNKNACYLVGFVDWSNVYQAIEKARRASGVADQKGQLADAAARKTVRDQYLPAIEEGLRMTNRAVELDAGYADAMAYVNLLLRAKAAIVDDPAEVAALIAQADVWAKKALDARNQQRNSPPPPAAPAGRLDVNATPPSLPVVAPPPPPPPPPPPKDFGNQPASASPGPSRHPGLSPDTGSFWQVIGDGSATAKALVAQLLDKGFPARLVGTPDAVWVMVGPYSNQQALNKAKAELEAAGVRPLRMW
jgi:beta-lactamase regulating signal transducer with metallopeptidase domain